MVKLTFIDSTGAEFGVDASAGVSVMEAAIANDIPSIVGFCGGMSACGTCHCYPAALWAQKLPPPLDNEIDTLKRVLDRHPESRLGCQIRLHASLDGLLVRLPARQRVP